MSKRNLLITSLIILVVMCGIVITTTRAAGDLTPKEARRLIARLAGIQLPSDAVRVKEVSATGNSATVVAQVETAFRLIKAATANGESRKFAPVIVVGKTSTCWSRL